MSSSSEAEAGPRRSFQLGRRLDIPAIPPDPARMRVLDAGPLVFGIEPRHIDESVFDEHFDADVRARTNVAELRVGSGIDDGGVSVHVFDAATMTEHLRFDCFDENPHYHYQCPGADHLVVTYDPAANGPMHEWVVERVRGGHLPEMLRFGGAPELAELVAPLDLEQVAFGLTGEISRSATTTASKEPA